MFGLLKLDRLAGGMQQFYCVIIGEKSQRSYRDVGNNSLRSLHILLTFHIREHESYQAQRPRLQNLCLQSSYWEQFAKFYSGKQNFKKKSQNSIPYVHQSPVIPLQLFHSSDSDQTGQGACKHLLSIPSVLRKKQKCHRKHSELKLVL